MATSTAIIVFTFKSVERLLREGGTSSWRLNRNHAKKCAFAVCIRNSNRNEAEDDLEDPAHVHDAPKTEEHQSAFLVGKISNVVQCPRHGADKRFLIQFSEYARVNIPDARKGDRNPVKYGTLEGLGIDPSTLQWEPMPAPGVVTPVPAASKKTIELGSSAIGPLTMADAKKGLALTFGVPPEAIEITIRG
jgi:hypothetical protein